MPTQHTNFNSWMTLIPSERVIGGVALISSLG